MRLVAAWPLAVLVLVAACAAAEPPPPAPLDTVNEMCGLCRMVIYDARLASQIVAPMEEPIFFDDLGCLRDHLARSGGVPPRAAVYVTDHLSGAWVRAEAALYTKSAELQTPMGSRLIAHATAASRDTDPSARGGVPMTSAELFGIPATQGPTP